MSFTEEQFDSLLVGALNLDGPHQFSAGTLMEDLPNLDSLRFMQLINAIEAATGMSLTPEDLMDTETVGDLKTLVIGGANGPA